MNDLVQIVKIRPAAPVIMAILIMVFLGCSGPGDTAASSTGTGLGGAGGEGGGIVSSSSGGGGGGPADKGAPATDMVSAGDVSKSANYIMVHTFGQSTQNQGEITSPAYRLQGGLNGANGSLP